MYGDMGVNRGETVVLRPKISIPAQFLRLSVHEVGFLVPEIDLH